VNNNYPNKRNSAVKKLAKTVFGYVSGVLLALHFPRDGMRGKNHQNKILFIASGVYDKI